MAENGWQLSSLSKFLLKFKKADTLTYYKVTLQEEPIEESQQHTWIGQTGDFHVYQTAIRPEDIMLDISKERLAKEQKHLRWRYGWLPLLILFCGWTLCYGYPDIFLFLLSYNIILMLIALFLICIPISFFMNVRTPSISTAYDKENKRIRLRSVCLVSLGVTLFFLCVCAAVILGKNHPNGTFFVVLLVGLYGLDQYMEYHFAKQHPNIPFLILALLLYITLHAIIHFAPPFFVTPRYEQGSFSQKATMTAATKGESMKQESWLLKRQTFEISQEHDYFQYERYDTKAAFITKLAMRSFTATREMQPIFDAHGVTVYRQKQDELILPGQEKMKWQPYLILRKENHIIAIKSNDDFTTKRIERIIDELDW